MAENKFRSRDMMARCVPMSSLQSVLGGKWKILILCYMNSHHTARYGELRRAIVGITNTMLAQSLKELEKDGFVKRYQYDEMPVRVDYSLTDKSLSLLPILLELKEWGAANL